MSGLTKHDVQVWLDAYVAAWTSYERTAIEALFSDDAEGRCREFTEWFMQRP